MLTKFRQSILLKLILVNAIILGFVLGLLAFLLSMWYRFDFFYEKRSLYEETCKYISVVANEFRGTEPSEFHEKEFNNIGKIASSAIDTQITFYDINKNIVFECPNGTNHKELEKPVISDKQLELLRQGNYVEIIDKDYTYVYPIFIDNEFQAYIEMTTSLSSITKKLHRIYLIIWISLMCTMLFSIIILTLFSKKIFIGPLAAMNNMAKKFANGEVDKRVEVKSTDEIGELSKSFNIMAESLEKVENNRKEFISSVSHELRSPITSIKGFIAGILDGVVPQDKEREYLERTYSEIKRLTRLINDLLDLSAIESGKLKFNMKKVDINELIRLCVINNEGKINAKQIRVEVLLKNKKTYVITDKDKTMQVITNLIDNAIKYCNKCGNIRIRTYSNIHKIFVEIYNDGPKLTEEEFIHIWDRFYKSDKARTSKISTGLGLPIVRMILKQQGEEIYAKNDDEKGVSFIFSLKKYKL